MLMIKEAKDCYVFLTETSYLYGVISADTYRERVNFHLHLNRHEQDAPENIEDENVNTHAFELQLEHSEDGADELVLYFSTKKGFLKSQWRFDVSDPDGFPGVPHGHLVTNPALKLDCYLGYTYDTANRNKQLMPESRKFIVSLWNNQEFRTFATKQLAWFVTNNPKYRFDVPNPIQSPKSS